MQRMVYVIYNTGIDADVDKVLEDLEIEGYTKVFNAHGLGGSGKKVGTPVWPGTNNVLLIVLPEERIEGLVHAIDELKSSFRKNPGISVFSVPAERYETRGTKVAGSEQQQEGE